MNSTENRKPESDMPTTKRNRFPFAPFIKGGWGDFYHLLAPRLGH